MNRTLRHILAGCLFLAASVAAYPQTTRQEYLERYNLLVKNLGQDGVGIETLIGRWGEAFPDDLDMLIASFNYYYTKSQRTEVVRKEESKYLGMEPVLNLKDSLGTPYYYFQETFYDDELYGKASAALAKAISLNPDRLDLRFYRISAELQYEKDSPDMTRSDLMSLIVYHFTQKPQWKYPDVESVDDEFFATGVQEYCVTLFHMASPSCMGAFRAVSEKMLEYMPKSDLFLCNVGSYFLIGEKDTKQALKYYQKSIKYNPSSYTAIKNCVILAREEKNVKMEKKYLQMLADNPNATEAERLSAEARVKLL